MKRLKKSISLLIIIAMLVALLPASAYAQEGAASTDETLAITNEVKSTNENVAENGNANIPLSDWLKYMPDDIPISRINMLASHDSGCYSPFPMTVLCALCPALIPFIGLIYTFTEGAAKTQQGTITYQLNQGARVFDVRGDYFWVNSDTDPFDMWVNHKLPMRKSAFMELRVEDVFNEIQKFLKSHSDETVILCMNYELGSDTSKELLNKLMEYSPCREYPEFIYYKGGSDVPLLRDVRGKCVVLNMQDNPTTEYANHCSAPPKEKEEYLEHFFKTHNNGNPEFSNKLAQYKKDTFCRQGEYANKTGIEKDPQVKEISYTANVIGKHFPKDIANHVKPIYGKDKYFKSEVRYGWVYMDFIGDGRDPVNGIISSNVGSTNYYISIDETGFTYPFWIDDNYVELVGSYTENGETKETSFELSKYETKVVEETVGGKTTISASVIGLPLYAPNGEKYNYTIKVEDRYKLINKTKSTDDNYKILDGKWCGREIRESAKIVEDVTTYPMEIQYIVDPGVTDAEFTAPTNHNDFFNYKNGICKALVFERKNTKTKKIDYVKVEGYNQSEFDTYLENFEHVESGKYYNTAVKNFVGSNSDDEPYSYKLKEILFWQRDISNIYLTGEVVPGTEGKLRAVIHVKKKAARVDVPGEINWWDGGDAYGKRGQVASFNSGGIFNDLKLEAHTSEDVPQEWNIYESDYKEITTTNNKTNFTVNIIQNENVKPPFTFQYGESYLVDKVYSDLGGYYKKVAIDEANPNKVTYALHGKADVMVVWNGEIPAGTTSKQVNVVSTDFSGYTYEFTATKPSGETSDTVWTSEQKMLPLFLDEDSSADFHIDTSGLSVTGFKCSVGVICDEDKNGVPIRHFILWYDKETTGEETLVSGTVTWIDGGEEGFIESGADLEPTKLGEDVEPNLPKINKSRIDWCKENIHVYQTVEGQAEKEVENISSMTWSGNHYSISLPSKIDGKDVTYRVDMADYKPSRYIKFDKEITKKDQNIYDIKYTRKIAVKLVTNLNGRGDILSNTDKLEFYRNGVKDTTVSFDDTRLLYNDQPIADDNNIRYSYDIKYTREDPDYITDHKSSGWNEDQLRWEVEIYKYKITDIKLPVSIKVEGSKSSHNYTFILSEGIDANSPNDLTLEENSTGEFTLSGKNMTEPGVQYQFDVYQKIPDGSGDKMIYDTHVSCVYVTASYDDENQNLKIEWADSDEQEAKKSMFTNTNYDGKKLALYEDEKDYVLDEVIFNEGETPSTMVVPHMPETEEHIYVFEKWNKIDTREEDVKKAHGWPESRIVVYKPIFKQVPKYVMVTFVDEDGSTVLDSHQTKYGEVPEYKGAEPTKPADREYIYPFEGWNPVLKPITEDTVFILPPITEDTVFKAVYVKEPIDYKFTKGDGSIYTIKSPNGLEFRVNGPKDYLVNIQIDFKDIEPEMISTSSDETGFILSTEILDKLKKGEHVLTAEYRNGSIPMAVFAVKEDPNTGDPNNIILWMILLLAGIGGIIFAVTWGRKRN